MNSKTEGGLNRLRTISSLPTSKLYIQTLSNNEKIANEFLLMSKETKSEVQGALNKYTFNNEVFIPTPLRISKKEYQNKNYLLNNLVNFEKDTLKRRSYIEPLRTETKRFSKQYQLLMYENKEHQQMYLEDLKKYYKSNGYKLNGIGNVDQIFNPSFLLDNNFGNNISDDAFRYGDKEYKNDFNFDENLMSLWNKGISETKDNRSKLSKENEDRDIDDFFQREEDINKKKLILEEERMNIDFKRQLESIKMKLLEEKKIRNMSKKAYSKYSSELKKEINKTKKTIEDLSTLNSSYNKTRNNKIESIPKNIINKTYKIIHPTHDKNYKQKIVFSSENNKRKSLEDSPSSKAKKKSQISSPKKSDFFISLDKDKDKEKKKNKLILPNIQIVKTEGKKNKSKDKSLNKKGKITKSKKQIKELNDLYNLVSKNKEDFFENYPNKRVENYFTKFVKKRLPVLNVKKGSNVHGIFDDFQQIVNKKNFYKIAKSSNDIKKDFDKNKKNLSANKEENINKFDCDKIQEIDEQIPVMHYMFAEELMAMKNNGDN